MLTLFPKKKRLQQKDPTLKVEHRGSVGVTLGGAAKCRKGEHLVLFHPPYCTGESEVLKDIQIRDKA